MAAPIGNEFFKMVKAPTGRPKSFESPEALWNEAIKYFQWVTDNPLYEFKMYGASGKTKAMPKMRAMTEKAFCLFSGISEQTFRNYKKAPESNDSQENEFFEVSTRISSIIYQQKFEGAAADFLNSNIIARDLGLKEKSEIDLSRTKITVTDKDE